LEIASLPEEVGVDFLILDGRSREEMSGRLPVKKVMRRTMKIDMAAIILGSIPRRFYWAVDTYSG
jgi:hypothetical protein